MLAQPRHPQQQYGALRVSSWYSRLGWTLQIEAQIKPERSSQLVSRRLCAFLLLCLCTPSYSFDMGEQSVAISIRVSSLSLSESILVEMKAPFCCKICCVYTCTQKEEHHRNEESDFMDERKRTVQSGMNGNEMREERKRKKKTFTCPDKTALAGHENPSGFLDWSCKKERKKKRRRRKSHVFSRTALMCKMLLLVFSPRLETDVALFPAHQNFFFVALFLIFTSLVVVYDWARLFGSYKLRGSTLHPFMPSFLDLEKFTWWWFISCSCNSSNQSIRTLVVGFLSFFFHQRHIGWKEMSVICMPSQLYRS